MKIQLLIATIFVSISCMAQELYSFTEPASNRPAGSIGFRVDNSMMDQIDTSKINYHMIPEIMVGISKKWTLHANGFFSNRTERFRMEGGSIYSKYRFLSKDAIQQHFRMAVFGRISTNNSDIHQEEINLNGHNSGYEIGVVATQLLRKVALSSSVTYLKARNNGKGNKFIYSEKEREAINYTLSFGKLMLPKEYKTYRQTNLNFMVEFLNQLNLGSGKYYMDVAPVIQMIFNSQTKIDIGYRKELSSTLLRTAPNGFFVRLEHTFFDRF
jgi:hypothetical protein